MNRIILTLLLGVISVSQAKADPSTDVDICHWQDYSGVWKLITVSDNAVEKHLTIHDDALPGGMTNFTGITLDESCAEVSLPSCGDCITEGGNDYPGCEVKDCEDAVVAAEDTTYCVDIEWDYLCSSEATVACVQGGICYDPGE